MIMSSAKLKLDILLERKKFVLFIFFFLKKMPNFLLNNMLSYDTQLYLENPERRFSKIIYV
jgi:hypothetical protein